jgi:hypothetical protein
MPHSSSFPMPSTCPQASACGREREKGEGEGEGEREGERKRECVKGEKERVRARARERERSRDRVVRLTVAYLRQIIIICAGHRPAASEARRSGNCGPQVGARAPRIPRIGRFRSKVGNHPCIAAASLPHSLLSPPLPSPPYPPSLPPSLPPSSHRPSNSLCGSGVYRRGAHKWEAQEHSTQRQHSTIFKT